MDYSVNGVTTLGKPYEKFRFLLYILPKLIPDEWKSYTYEWNHKNTEWKYETC